MHFRCPLRTSSPGGAWTGQCHDEYDVAFAICGLVETDPRIAQIGCLLRPDHHGKGYATEMLAELVTYAFKGERIQRL